MSTPDKAPRSTLFKNGEFRDKNGIVIEPYDVLKVFHFIGARRKRHFMYKLAKEKDGYLRFYHLTKDDSCYDPRSQDMADVEIVQSENWEKL